MTPERYQRLGKLFDRAQALAPAERAAFLQQACAGDLLLRAELDRLLAHDQEARREQLLQEPCPVNARAFLAGNEPGTVPGAPPGAEPEDGLVGRQLGPYRIEQRLGRGGMGVVYRAADTLLKRQVAIKVLPRSAWGDADRLRRLLREAEAVARLSHPNIAVIHHVDQWEGGYFLVLELLPGGSLQARLDRGGALPWPEATRALIDACRGLHAAHAAGFVHRDVKPSNLLCDAAGLVKVADFGLVRGGQLTATSTDCVAGTPHYMSPEQCRAEPVDARSDVYALGATYFALLTGRPPYRGDAPVHAMFAHCEAPVPDPRAHIPDLPEGCAAVVRKAMGKDPAGRFQTAAEMLDALMALAPGPAEPVPAPAASARPVSPSPPRRSLVRPAAGVLAGVALVVGIAWVATLGWPGWHGSPSSAPEESPPARPAPPPVRAFATDIPGGGLALPVGGKVQAVAFSHEGKMLAAGDAEPRPALPRSGGSFAWDVATGRELCHPWPDLPILCLAFSYDGRLLMGSHDGSQSHILSTGKDEHWCHDVGAVGSLALTRDGSILAIGFSAGDYQGHVKRYNYGGSEIYPVIGGEEPGPPVQQLLFSPHDHTLAVAYQNGQVNLYADDKQGDPVQVRPSGPGPPPALAFAPDQRVLAVARSRELRWWNLERGAWEARVLSTDQEITALAYTPDGRYLVVAGKGPDVVLQRATTAQKVYTFQGHHGSVYGLACHPNGEILATGGGDGDVRVWDLRAAIAAAGPGAD
jgi:serine/threonine protein kinase